MKKKFARAVGLMGATVLTLSLVFGCAPKKPTETAPPKVIETVGLTNSFESEKDVGLINVAGGIKMQNTAGNYVLRGNSSLRFHVERAAFPKFSFSENARPYNIEDYDYLSFWVYIDGAFPLSLRSSIDSGNLICSSIRPKTWTKIKLEKGSELFRKIQYDVSFGWYTFEGIGANYATAMECDIYLDDIRVWKEGENGESDLAVVDGSRNDIEIEMPVGEIGKTYTLPDVVAYGPDGAKIFGAEIEKKVFDPKGAEIGLTEEAFIPESSGTYELVCDFEYMGIANTLRKKIEIKIADFEDIMLAPAVCGQTYLLTAPKLFEVGSNKEVFYDMAIVVSKDGEEIAIESDGLFVPEQKGAYDVTYSITRTYQDVVSTDSVTHTLWSLNSAETLADFSADESRMFAKGTSDVTVEVANGETYKLNNREQNSLKISVTAVNYPTFGFSESFPIRDLSEYEYLSMWVYNGANQDVDVVCSEANGVVRRLAAENWTRIRYARSELNKSADFRNATFTMYEARDDKGAISADFYIDDIRVWKSGFAEELDFDPSVTTTDYNEALGTGRMIVTNTMYTACLNVFTRDGKQVDKANVVGLQDNRGSSVQISTEGEFTPKRTGRHILTLSYEKDGIFNSVTKAIDVQPQMQYLSITLAPYGEVGKSMLLDLPTLYNHGVPDNDIAQSISFTDPKGEKHVLENEEFVPELPGRYSIELYARDENTNAYASTTVEVPVFAAGKLGVIADFEDGDLSQVDVTNYFWGNISELSITNERAHSGNSSAVFTVLSDITQFPEFYLKEGNIAGDISRAKAFSFWVYIEDPAEKDFFVTKSCYFNWVDQQDPSYNKGTLNQVVRSNQWVQVRVERKDFETVLGGTYFDGSPMLNGGSHWAAADNRNITSFAFCLSGYKPIGEGVKIYLDDIQLEV